MRRRWRPLTGTSMKPPGPKPPCWFRDVGARRHQREIHITEIVVVLQPFNRELCAAERIGASGTPLRTEKPQLVDRQCAFLQYVQKFLTYGAAGTYDCDFHFIDRLDCLVVSVEVPSCGPRGIVRFVSRKIHRRPRYRFRPCGRHRSPRRSCIGASGSVVRKCPYGRCRTDRRCKHFSRTHPR